MAKQDGSDPRGALRRRSSPVDDALGPEGVVVFESHHADDFVMLPRRNAFLKILLVVAGRGAVEGDWGRVACGAGDAVVVPPGLSHRLADEPRRPMSVFGVGISPDLFCFAPQTLATIPTGRIRASQTRSLDLQSRLRRLLYLASDGAHRRHLPIVATALSIAAELSMLGDAGAEAPASEADSGDVIEGYLAWLGDNFFEPLTLDHAARHCGMSRRAFTDAFRRATGTTWLAWLRQLRLRHARRLLDASDQKITSIAFQCGFEDLSTFYRLFQKETGTSPGAYRRASSAAGGTERSPGDAGFAQGS